MKRYPAPNSKNAVILFIVFSFFLFLPTHDVKALTLTPIRLEISGDPGQTLSEEVTLINERQTPETYYSSFENFQAQGETGSPQFVTATDDLGTWMKSPEEVTLAPGQTKIVPITITIPKNAEPGGHFAGAFWGTVPQVQTGGQVAIGAKTGVLVLLSVSGPISEKGGILEFATDNKQTYFTSLPVDFYYRFENGGSDRIKPAGDITIKDMIGLTATKISGNPVEGNILPQSIRKIETSWSGSDTLNPGDPIPVVTGFWNNAMHEWRNFAFGHYTATITLAYGTKNDSASASFAFWVFPWQLLLVVIIGLLLALFLIRTIVIHYNNWVIGRAEKMLEKMQEQKNEKNENEHPAVTAAKTVKKIVLPKKRKKIQ